MRATCNGSIWALQTNITMILISLSSFTISYVQNLRKIFSCVCTCVVTMLLNDFFFGAISVGVKHFAQRIMESLNCLLLHRIIQNEPSNVMGT